MKTVFKDSAMVCHVWAQQNQPKGEAGNIFFEGATIYSYGRHFPMATIIKNKKGDTAVLINSDTYSNSTTRQQSYVRNASNHYQRLFARKELVQYIAYGNIDNKNLSEKIGSEVEKYIIYMAKSANARRMAKKKADDIQEAICFYHGHLKILDFYGAKMPKRIIALKDMLVCDFAAVVAQNQRQLKAENKKIDKARAERQAREKIADDAALINFIEGGNLSQNERHYLVMLETVHMRVHGDNIETSKGAVFPIEHAKKAFSFILNCKQSGEAWHKNGHTVHLGNFQLDSIDENGNVIAGCHKVQWPAIEQVAKQLGLI